MVLSLTIYPAFFCLFPQHLRIFICLFDFHFFAIRIVINDEIFLSSHFILALLVIPIQIQVLGLGSSLNPAIKLVMVWMLQECIHLA